MENFIMNELEDQAALFADENWDSYFDSESGDYKHAWCEAYTAYMENEDDVRR